MTQSQDQIVIKIFNMTISQHIWNCIKHVWLTSYTRHYQQENNSNKPFYIVIMVQHLRKFGVSFPRIKYKRKA